MMEESFWKVKFDANDKPFEKDLGNFVGMKGYIYVYAKDIFEALDKARDALKSFREWDEFCLMTVEKVDEEE